MAKPISTVTNEDCMIMMSRYPDKYFELAIVDPPYGIGSYWKKSIHTKNHCNKKWNEAKPSGEYFTELFRVSQNQVIWGGNYFTKHLPETNSWLIWDKLMNNNPTSDCELAWTSFKIKMTKITVRWSGALKDEENFNRVHPCQRPVKLHTKTLSLLAKTGDKILDTHLGSGSSRIAAYNMGFDFYGCELDPDYFKASEKRFKEQTMQSSLFTGLAHSSYPESLED